MSVLIQYLYTEIYSHILTYINNIRDLKIIDGDLISSPLTFGNLVQDILPVITALIIVVLIAKAFIKLMGGVFTWK